MFSYETEGDEWNVKMIWMRFEEVRRMFIWVSKDRSKDRRDDDAIKADRKKIKEEDLFMQ